MIDSANITLIETKALVGTALDEVKTLIQGQSQDIVKVIGELKRTRQDVSDHHDEFELYNKKAREANQTERDNLDARLSNVANRLTACEAMAKEAKLNASVIRVSTLEDRLVVVEKRIVESKAELAAFDRKIDTTRKDLLLKISQSVSQVQRPSFRTSAEGRPPR